MQRKRNNEKITREKKSFSTYKMCFCISFSLDYNSNRTTRYKEVLEYSRISLVMFDGLFFFKLTTPSTLRGCNFLNFIPFLTIFCAPDMSIKGVQVLFGHQKQQSLPLESGLPWVLKCLITSWFTWLKMESGQKIAN